MQCKYCGCTDQKACEGGCVWIVNEICSSCVVYVPRQLLGAALYAMQQIPILADLWRQMSQAERLNFINSLKTDAYAVQETYDEDAGLGLLPEREELVEEYFAEHGMPRPETPPQIVLATEADVPPFMKGLQL